MDKTECRTPASEGTTRIPTWKFDAMRAAIRDALAGGPLPATELVQQASARIPGARRAEFGSLGWHATTVRLEMEVRGELERLPGSPVTLRRTDL